MPESPIIRVEVKVQTHKDAQRIHVWIPEGVLILQMFGSVFTARYDSQGKRNQYGRSYWFTMTPDEKGALRALTFASSESRSGYTYHDQSILETIGQIVYHAWSRERGVIT